MNQEHLTEHCRHCDIVQHSKYRIDLGQITQSITHQRHAARVHSIHRTVYHNMYLKGRHGQ